MNPILTPITKPFLPSPFVPVPKPAFIASNAPVLKPEYVLPAPMPVKVVPIQPTEVKKIAFDSLDKSKLNIVAPYAGDRIEPDLRQPAPRPSPIIEPNDRHQSMASVIILLGIAGLVYMSMKK
jgi:hypothetical protein